MGLITDSMVFSLISKIRGGNKVIGLFVIFINLKKKKSMSVLVLKLYIAKPEKKL